MDETTGHVPAGVLVLDKPAGITSAQAVSIVKRLLPRGTKVGHAGTLDRFATGVLLVLIGRATKLCESLMGQPKTYEATVKLGATTETHDPESAERPFAPTRGPAGHTPSPEDVLAALTTMIGEVHQRPPRFSALKVAGKRASDRVRAGQEIELEPRLVRIESIAVLEYAWPLLHLRINCGRGTYVRSIARDLGELLDVGGYLVELRRTRIGAFGIERAVAPSALDRESISRHICPAAPADVK